MAFIPPQTVQFLGEREPNALGIRWAERQLMRCATCDLAVESKVLDETPSHRLVRITCTMCHRVRWAMFGRTP